MKDIRIEKMAELLVDYSVGVKRGDKVAIQGETLAEPLLKAIYTKVLQAGGHPFLLVSPPGIDEILYRFASDEQLKHVPPPVKLIMDTYDVRISIGAESNTRALTSVDPAKIVTRQQSRTELMRTFMQRAARGELRWTYAIYPIDAYAQDAEMSLSEYEDFVFTACLGDVNDPVGYWKRFSAWQQKIIEWLNGKKKIHIVAPETDLYLSVEGRKFLNCDGHENMPDGEIFTGPVEDSIEGHVYFSYPAIENGREVSGIRLWFEKGQVVKATAEKNQEFLLKTLDTDEGARRVGEFAFGTNRGITSFTRQILFDEKINGSFHMALGASYPETGGKNESAIHWDMICDMRSGGEVTVDGELFYKDGKFVIPI
ncbi:MAG: aminopeptidase [Dehalococcoidales bacterium]|jgi:aminopeptidase|nr:aminopeptidase [Dehalococcoidales bacterium]